MHHVLLVLLVPPIEGGCKRTHLDLPKEVCGTVNSSHSENPLTLRDTEAEDLIIIYYLSIIIGSALSAYESAANQAGHFMARPAHTTRGFSESA